MFGLSKSVDELRKMHETLKSRYSHLTSKQIKDNTAVKKDIDKFLTAASHSLIFLGGETKRVLKDDSRLTKVNTDKKLVSEWIGYWEEHKDPKEKH